MTSALPVHCCDDYTIEIERDQFVNDAQPTDGFVLVLRDTTTKKVLETFEFDHSYTPADAVAEVLEQC